MAATRRHRRPGLLDTVAATCVIDGTPELTARAVNRQPAGAAELELLVDVGDGGPPVAVGPADSDLMTQLTRLAELHRAGSLTDAEFTAAKALILGG